MTQNELNLTGERGDAQAIRGKLKATTLWDSPNSSMSNCSGFFALAAGNRNSNGEYIVLNQYTDFWTSSAYETDNGFL